MAVRPLCSSTGRSVNAFAAMFSSRGRQLGDEICSTPSNQWAVEFGNGDSRRTFDSHTRSSFDSREGLLTKVPISTKMSRSKKPNTYWSFTFGTDSDTSTVVPEGDSQCQR